jgi:hypothetical protein
MLSGMAEITREWVTTPSGGCTRIRTSVLAGGGGHGRSWPGRQNIAAGSVGSPERLIVLGVEPNALARLVGDHRFQRNLITGIIGLVALARLVREGETRSFARLAA